MYLTNTKANFIKDGNRIRNQFKWCLLITEYQM
jgi:hypothetical protein